MVDVCQPFKLYVEHKERDSSTRMLCPWIVCTYVMYHIICVVGSSELCMTRVSPLGNGRYWSVCTIYNISFHLYVGRHILVINDVPKHDDTGINMQVSG